MTMAMPAKRLRRAVVSGCALPAQSEWIVMLAMAVMAVTSAILMMMLAMPTAVLPLSLLSASWWEEAWEEA